MLTPELTGAVLELVSAGAVLVVTYLVAPWLRGKAKSQAATAAIDALVGAVGPAVAATEQVVARKLRAAKPLVGLLTPDQAEHALVDALDRVALQLGPARFDALAKALGKDHEGLLELVRSHIEAAVLRLKTTGRVS